VDASPRAERLPFFAGEDSAYPVAGNQTHSQGRIDIRKMIARIRLTEEAMADLVSSEASFRNGMTDEKTRLTDDVARREEQAFGMDGRGVLALQNGASRLRLSAGFSRQHRGLELRQPFHRHRHVPRAINPASGVLRSNVKQVTAVASDGTTATLTADPSWTDNDYIVHAANATVTSTLDTALRKAYWGLPALIDDSTNRDNYFGILRSQVLSLQSYVVASVGALSVDVAQRTADVVFQRLGGSSI
jgi:plasmid maintenance system antidote protein VapI